MKKKLALLLSGALSACGGNSENGGNKSKQQIFTMKIK